MKFIVNSETHHVHIKPGKERCNLDDADKDNLREVHASEAVMLLREGFIYCPHCWDSDD